MHLGKCSQLHLETMDFKMGTEIHETGSGQSVPVNGMLSTIQQLTPFPSFFDTLEILHKAYVYMKFPND